MKLRVYKYQNLFIITLLDEEGAFITSSGHRNWNKIEKFLIRCEKRYGITIEIDYLGELDEKLPPIHKVSKLLRRG